jgi:kynurenine formamidase
VAVDIATSNWGRWGSDDQLGALNLLSDSSRCRALAAVQFGRLYSLAYPLGAKESPRTPSRNPPWHTTTIDRKRNGTGVADDVLTIHSHIGTHLDALCHYWGRTGLYNGYAHEEIVSSGAPHLSIDRVPGIVSSAVLIDVSGACPNGREALGWEVTVDHMTNALSKANKSIEPGDAVLLHTGWGKTFSSDPELYNWGSPGIGAAAADWLAKRDIVLVGADNFAIEAIPPKERGHGLPVHQILLNGYGIYLLENLALTSAIQAEGTARGLLMLAPLPIRGGSGSPLNPLLLI